MNEGAVRRALWICDYFPRPHDMTSGTWALESVKALRDAGLPAAVLAPTPWIPRWLAVTAFLQDWSGVPREWEIDDIPIHYPRCPHYPRRWMVEHLYNRVPLFDTALLWPWCRAAADRVMDAYPFDVVHANFLFPSGYLGLKLKQRFGTPLVVHEWSVQRLAMAQAHRGRRRAYRRILRGADAVITLNHQMARQLRQLEPAISDLRVFREHGVNPKKARMLRRKRPARYSDKLVVLSVGALSERKGHEYLVRAVAEIRSDFPALVCRIIGAGPRQGELRELVQRLDLEGTVELVGRMPHDEVLGAMSWCDIFALPSWGEAIGTVYGEAMQFGKPIIACAGEGIGEVVADGVHGFLVEPRNVSDLASALRRLLEDDPVRKRMGEKAREVAVAELSYPRLAARLIELYGGLTRGPGDGAAPFRTRTRRSRALRSPAG